MQRVRSVRLARLLAHEPLGRAFDLLELDDQETLAICRTLEAVRAAFAAAVAEKPDGRFLIRFPNAL